MKKISILVLFMSMSLVSCNVQQSICLYDPDQHLNKAQMKDCIGVYELQYSKTSKGFWELNGDVPSKCEVINVEAITHGGELLEAAQYKANNLQAATTLEVFKKEGIFSLKNIYTNHNKKNETCVEQYRRHKVDEVEFQKWQAEGKEN